MTRSSIYAEPVYYTWNETKECPIITGREHVYLISYSIDPTTTPTSATAMPAPRLIWIILAPFAFDLVVPEDDDAEEVAVVEPFCCFAAAWNAAKLLGPDSTELTLNTMPEPQ